MAFFTKTIYNAIMVSVSGGDVSPLVGHNAFLRWALMKECAFEDEAGRTKYWSEAHVSEDFDIAIRFQVSHCRLSTSCSCIVEAHRMLWCHVFVLLWHATLALCQTSPMLSIFWWSLCVEINTCDVGLLNRLSISLTPLVRI